MLSSYLSGWSLRYILHKHTIPVHRYHRKFSYLQSLRQFISTLNTKCFSWISFYFDLIFVRTYFWMLTFEYVMVGSSILTTFTLEAIAIGFSLAIFFLSCGTSPNQTHAQQRNTHAFKGKSSSVFRKTIRDLLQLAESDFFPTGESGAQGKFGR